MNLRLATLAFLLALTAAEAADAPPGATACSGCHAGSAGVDTPATRLIGMKADDILAAMVAKGFTEPEAAAIANWYATQPN